MVDAKLEGFKRGCNMKKLGYKGQVNIDDCEIDYNKIYRDLYYYFSYW